MTEQVELSLVEQKVAAQRRIAGYVCGECLEPTDTKVVENIPAEDGNGTFRLLVSFKCVPCQLDQDSVAPTSSEMTRDVTEAFALTAKNWRD